MTLLRSILHGVYRLAGVDPHPVVAIVHAGDPGRRRRMDEEVTRITGEYSHIRLSPGTESAGELWLRWRRELRGRRTGMIAVPFEDSRAALAASFLLCPLGVLAYNRRLERLHLKWNDLISSLLFLAAVPLDRVRLRPHWWPGRKERDETPDRVQRVEGRRASPLRPAVAVLAPYLPWPLSHGGAVRMYHLLRECAQDFDIHLFAFTESAREAADPGPLPGMVRRITLVSKPRYREPRWSTLWPPEAHEYRSPAMERALAEFRGSEAGAPVQVEYTQLAPYGGTILVEHDITFDLYRQVFEQSRRLAAWWDWWRWRRFERQMLDRFPRVVVMSEKDRAISGAAKADVIANGVDLDRFRPTPEPFGRRLLFVGSFRHFPNAAAFQFFWERVWPLLEDCDLTVVAGPDAALHWSAFTGQEHLPSHPRLDLRGFEADVKPLYDAANLVVVPTLYSAGTNLKVLEAMAARRAVVSTPSGCAGLGLRHGESVLIASEPGELAAAIHELLASPARRAELAARAGELASAHFSWSALGARQRQLWRECCGGGLEIVEGVSGAGRYEGYPALLARWQGAPVGELVWRKLDAGEHEVLWVEVSDAWRRKGAGERLLDHAIRRGGTWFLEVRESNQAARSLYRKAGFEEVGRRRGYYADPEDDAVQMRFTQR